MLMIPIDTGNKAIKTEHFEFHSGLTMLEDVPGENEEAFMYQGKYYRLSYERNVYLPDKTLDDRYYLLTLFAIAKELEELRHSRTFIPGELISMDLVVGLPPLYYRGSIRNSENTFIVRGDWSILCIWENLTGLPLQMYSFICRHTLRICIWRKSLDCLHIRKC